jgi:hypothetical protein
LIEIPVTIALIAEKKSIGKFTLAELDNRYLVDKRATQTIYGGLRGVITS